MILIDSYSRRPEVVPMRTTTASQTRKELRLIFARFSLPEQILTDNGSQFVSEEFQEFTRSNGIQHIKIAPYHPRSNGMAERFVQTFKTAMRKKVNEHQSEIGKFPISLQKDPTIYNYGSASHVTHEKNSTKQN